MNNCHHCGAKVRRCGGGAHTDRRLAAGDENLVARQRIRRKLSNFTNFVGQHHLAAQCLCLILQSRRRYNEAVQKYNTDLSLFPANVVASIAGYQRFSCASSHR